MAEFLTASEAKAEVVARKLEKEKEYVIGLINDAINAEKYKCPLSEASDNIIQKLREAGYYVSKVTQAEKNHGYVISWGEEVPTYKEAATAEDIANILASGEEKVYIELKDDMVIDDTNVITIPAGTKATVKVDNTVTLDKEGFLVEDGAELTLKGTGTINVADKTSSAHAVYASGPNALVTLDGVTIDTISTSGKEGNSAYGIYLAQDASLNVKSGVIKCAYGSCIATNNLTGGNTVVNITGGELYSDGSYAVYLAAQGVCNIKGGKVQGVNARMGHVNISGNAEIIPTTITAEGYDNIGKEFATTGCVWLGDTIAVMAGTYADTKGTDTSVKVSGDAVVKSNFRSAIGVYCVDTKAPQNVKVTVANKDNVVTTDAEFDAVKVYDHAYIKAEAEKAGKNYNPVAESKVTVA